MGTVVLDVGSKDYRSVCEVTKCCECATPDNWKNMGGGYSGGGHSGGAKCKGTGSCRQELHRGINSQTYFEHFCWGEIKIL